jgi:glycosyltransferase involved in cell wall biosynthesis
MDTKKQLKVFIDGYLLNKEPQGTTTYIKELYKEATLMNPEILFYIGCFDVNTIKKDFIDFRNLSFISYKNKSRIFRMIYEIPKLIKIQNFDFAHFQYVIPFYRNKKCKYITTIHDILFNDFSTFFSNIYRFKRNFLFRYSAKNSDYLLTVSNYSKNAIKKRYKLDNKKIYITPNGVSEIFFNPFDKEISKQLIKNNYGFNDFILYVSRIEPRKNQELLLKSYLKTDLDKTTTHLVFIGTHSIKNSNFQKSMQDLSKDQKNQIHYFEKIPQEDFIHFYKAAKLFIYPSKAEGFGIPPLEAAALKIPVLCSNSTAMRSYNFFEPYFCDPNDELAFISKFKEFIKNYNSIDLDFIQEKIKKQYSWSKSAKILTSIFKKNIEETSI